MAEKDDKQQQGVPRSKYNPNGLPFEDRKYSSEKIKSDPERCLYCGYRFQLYDPKHETEFVYDRIGRTLDHIMPKSDGGIKSKKNKSWCCEDCNKIKANMPPDQFLQVLRAMLEFEKIQHMRRVRVFKKMITNVAIIVSKRRNSDH